LDQINFVDGVGVEDWGKDVWESLPEDVAQRLAAEVRGYDDLASDEGPFTRGFLQAVFDARRDRVLARVSPEVGRTADADLLHRFEMEVLAWDQGLIDLPGLRFLYAEQTTDNLPARVEDLLWQLWRSSEIGGSYEEPVLDDDLASKLHRTLFTAAGLVEKHKRRIEERAK
jgi:hypothetical protein